MNPAQLLDHFDRISDAPAAIPRLRGFILDVAVRGKLVPQDPDDEVASALLDLVRKGTAAFAHYPARWITAEFGSLLDVKYGKGLPASDRKEHGQVPVFGSNGIVSYTRASLTTKPAIIIGRKGSAGALNLCDGPSWTTDVAYFLESPGFFDIQYLFLLLQTLDLGALGKGVKPGLSRSDVYPLRIAIPPIAEQRLIFAKVDELMALCDRLEAAQAERERRRDRLTATSLQRLNKPADTPAFREHADFHLRHLARMTTRPDQIPALREAILNFAVRGQLVAQSGTDEPASALLSRIHADKARLMKEGVIPRQKLVSSDLNGSTIWRPSTWATVTFGDVCNFVTSGSRGWAEYYSDSGASFIRAQNIRFGRLRLDDVARVNPPKKTEGIRTQVVQGDILIVITGAGVTNPALLDQHVDEAYVSQHVALCRPTTSTISPWLLLSLMAPAGARGELLERAYGAGKPGLNLDNIRSLVIPIAPLAEQNRIIAKVEELMTLCDRLEAQLATAQNESRRLLEAVLHEALA